MIPFLSILLIAVITIVAAGSIYWDLILLNLIQEAHAITIDEWVWAGGEKGVRLVPVFYVETVFCNGSNLHDKGCYDTKLDVITIKDGYRDMWTPRGCTILQHEQSHAWGLYDEVSVGTIFNCDNPNDKSETQGLYDPNNFFHFAPKQDYVVKVYDWDPDPRITKLQ